MYTNHADFSNGSMTHDVVPLDETQWRSTPLDTSKGELFTPAIVDDSPYQRGETERDRRLRLRRERIEKQQQELLRAPVDDNGVDGHSVVSWLDDGASGVSPRSHHTIKPPQWEDMYERADMLDDERLERTPRDHSYDDDAAYLSHSQPGFPRALQHEPGRMSPPRYHEDSRLSTPPRSVRQEIVNEQLTPPRTQFQQQQQQHVVTPPYGTSADDGGGKQSKRLEQRAYARELEEQIAMKNKQKNQNHGHHRRQQQQQKRPQGQGEVNTGFILGSGRREGPGYGRVRNVPRVTTTVPNEQHGSPLLRKHQLDEPTGTGLMIGGNEHQRRQKMLEQRRDQRQHAFSRALNDGNGSGAVSQSPSQRTAIGRGLAALHGEDETERQAKIRRNREYAATLQRQMQEKQERKAREKNELLEREKREEEEALRYDPYSGPKGGRELADPSNGATSKAPTRTRRSDPVEAAPFRGQSPDTRHTRFKLENQDEEARNQALAKKSAQLERQRQLADQIREKKLAAEEQKRKDEEYDRKLELKIQQQMANQKGETERPPESYPPAQSNDVGGASRNLASLSRNSSRSRLPEMTVAVPPAPLHQSSSMQSYGRPSSSHRNGELRRSSSFHRHSGRNKREDDTSYRGYHEDEYEDRRRHRGGEDHDHSYPRRHDLDRSYSREDVRVRGGGGGGSGYHHRMTRDRSYHRDSRHHHHPPHHHHDDYEDRYDGGRDRRHRDVDENRNYRRPRSGYHKNGDDVTSSALHELAQFKEAILAGQNLLVERIRDQESIIREVKSKADALLLKPSSSPGSTSVAAQLSNYRSSILPQVSQRPIESTAMPSLQPLPQAPLPLRNDHQLPELKSESTFIFPDDPSMGFDANQTMSIQQPPDQQPYPLLTLPADSTFLTASIGSTAYAPLDNDKKSFPLPIRSSTPELPPPALPPNSPSVDTSPQGGVFPTFRTETQHLLASSNQLYSAMDDDTDIIRKSVDLSRPTHHTATTVAAGGITVDTHAGKDATVASDVQSIVSGATTALNPDSLMARNAEKLRNLQLINDGGVPKKEVDIDQSTTVTRSNDVDSSSTNLLDDATTTWL